MDTYEPAPVHESDSDPDNTPDISVISCKRALEGEEVPASSIFKPSC